jgi:hypothetical protein
VLKASLPKSESETQPSAADTHPPPSPIPSAFQPDNPTGVSWSPHYPSSSVRTHLTQPDVQKDLAVGNSFNNVDPSYQENGGVKYAYGVGTRPVPIPFDKSYRYVEHVLSDPI